MRRKDFLDQLWQRVSEGRGLARYIWTRTIGHVGLLQGERRGMTGGRRATRIVYRTHVHARGKQQLVESPAADSPTRLLEARESI